ncbi:MAG: AAA family ATPase [Elusimicrobiota bacterium]
MESLVFFGKGGIGKSTICANLSALYGLSGRKVLHVGCDPKHDSTLAIAARSTEYVRTFMEKIAANESITDSGKLVLRGRFGIDLVEAGGPEPGVGCAGRGISLMLETFKETRLLENGGYDICVYDILGDVVCGGFATPLRAGFGKKVFIVCSEELMSIYAANNIAKAVRHYSPNGIRLAGLIANLRDAEVDRRPLERFAKLINTRILQYVPRDPAVREAEFKRETVVEHAPKAPVTRALARLATTALRLKHKALPLPTPLEDREFYALSYTQFKKSARRRKK